MAITCLLMAAKIEEHIQPSYVLMIELLEDLGITLIKREHLLKMEEQIIKSLDFNIRDLSSIHFLERFFQLFGIDEEKKKSNIS